MVEGMRIMERIKAGHACTSIRVTVGDSFLHNTTKENIFSHFPPHLSFKRFKEQQK